MLRRMTIRRSILFALLLLIAACRPATERFEAQFYVFGTLVNVTVDGTGRRAANALFGDLQQRFQAMHRDWHAWEPGELTRINQAFAAGDSISAPDDIRQLIAYAQTMETATGGCFNAAIGGLIRLWGFHTSEFPVLGPPPEVSQIAAQIAARPSSLDIDIRHATLSSRNRAVQLDFGGIAKGYAVDLALALAQKHTIPAALVNAGGDLAGYRDPALPGTWKIGLKDHRQQTLGGLALKGRETVFTSGNYQRFRYDAQQRYPHIIDPRNGWPVAEVASVTVVGRQGWHTDAATTALMVGGAAEFESLLAALDIEQAMMILENGDIRITRQLLQRLIEFRQRDRVIQVIDP